MHAAPRPAPPAEPISGSLLSVDDVADEQITYLLDLADHYAGLRRLGALAPRPLVGRTLINLFLEPSTRTMASFEIAAQRLGADVLSLPAEGSSLRKDESGLDTAQTLAAMGADVMVVRSKEAGLQALLAERLACPVVNGGDGAAEHPTQALLDAATLRAAKGRIEGLTVAIVGDVAHSRVAGSGAKLLKRLGAQVRFVGPAALMPEGAADVPRFETLREGLKDCDAVMALRVQRERMEDAEAPDGAAFHAAYGLTYETLAFARPDAVVMHPGPMNRGVEIDGDLADDETHSLVLKQVAYGVFTRMAILDALIGGRA
ncbi:MAG: aspartate carbamoyltransferase catalytic subunit [Pseudomonadota bacterium]